VSNPWLIIVRYYSPHFSNMRISNLYTGCPKKHITKYEVSLNSIKTCHWVEIFHRNWDAKNVLEFT